LISRSALDAQYCFKDLLVAEALEAIALRGIDGRSLRHVNVLADANAGWGNSGIFS